MQVAVQDSPTIAGFTALPKGLCGATMVLCPQRQGWSPGSRIRAARTCTMVSKRLLPAALCRKKWPCLFLCLWQMIITASKDAQIAAAYSQGQMPPMSRYEWTNASLEARSASQQSTSTFFVPLFPVRLTPPALPPPASRLDPSLFHLPRASLCQIKKCLPCVLSPAWLPQKRTSCI